MYLSSNSSHLSIPDTADCCSAALWPSTYTPLVIFHRMQWHQHTYVYRPSHYITIITAITVDTQSYLGKAVYLLQTVTPLVHPLVVKFIQQASPCSSLAIS